MKKYWARPRWAWGSSASHREMPSNTVVSPANPSNVSGAGTAAGEGVSSGAGEINDGVKVVGAPPLGNGGLMKSKSQGGRGRAAAGEPTDGARFFVEGRRSVSSHVDQANAGRVAASLHVKVVAADMPEFMQVHAFRCARRSYEVLDKFSPKQMAQDIKKEFDKVHGPVWHCIVGSSFGSFVTHSTGCFLCFSMENLLVMVFKTRVPRAN